MISAFRDKPYATIETEIGELALYQSCVKDEIRIEKEFNNKITKAEPYDYFKKWLKYIAHKSDYNPEDKSDLYEPTLKPDDIDKLSNPTLNNIAELIIKNSDYLYKKHIHKEIKKEDGSTVSSMSYGETIHPKKDDEDFAQYYFRLKCIQYEEMNKQMKAMVSKFSDISSYSKEIEDFLKSTSDLSKQVSEPMRRQFQKIQQSMDSLLPFSKDIQNQINLTRDIGKELSDSYKQMLKSQPDISSIQPSTVTHNPVQDIIELKRFQSPFVKLQKEIQTLIEYIRQSNDTQTLIASEIKKSSKESTSYSKTNVILTVIIILLSLFTIGASIYFSIDSSNQNKMSSFKVVEELQKINSTIKDDNKKEENYQKEMRKLEFRINSLENELDQKEEKFAHLYKQVEELRDSLATLTAIQERENPKLPTNK